VKLTTHLHLVLKLRMGGAMPTLPPIALLGAGRDCLMFLSNIISLTPLQFVHLFCNLWKCILLFFSCISSLLKIRPILDKLLEYKRTLIQHVNRMPRNTGCPTRYRTRHFFNNFTTNDDIATKFEADYRQIPLHFSHNERSRVQISLQYLHWY